MILKLESIAYAPWARCSGEYLFKNALLGHTRLSIQDLSSKGMQPMSNDNRYWLVFNSEIYNFKELKGIRMFKSYILF